MSEKVQLEIDGAIAKITMVDEDRGNALGTEMISALNQALDRVENDDNVNLLVVTGTGRSFAAGADIRLLAERKSADALHLPLNEFCHRLESMALPTIAAINGHAIGGGCELALACDLRIMAEGAKLGQPEVKLGVVPGAGGGARLVRMLGRARALHMILTGELISASTAHEWGLVSGIASSGELDARVLELGSQVVGNAPVAVALAKLLVVYGQDVDNGTAAFMERMAQGLAFGTADKNEGTNAFLEKRAPHFEGK